MGEIVAVIAAAAERVSAMDDDAVINEVGVVAALLSSLVAIVGGFAERKPGNFTPIQLISVIGAWALVLANASAITMAIRDGSLILLGTAAATLAIALVSFVRDGVASVSDR